MNKKYQILVVFNDGDQWVDQDGGNSNELRMRIEDSSKRACIRLNICDNLRYVPWTAIRYLEVRPI